METPKIKQRAATCCSSAVETQTKAFFEAADIEVVSSFPAVPLGALVEEPPMLMWEHQGRCQCGRRSYLFGQCSKCLKEEMLEKAAEEQRRLAEEPEEPPPHTVEMDPGSAGGQDSLLY